MPLSVSQNITNKLGGRKGREAEKTETSPLVLVCGRKKEYKAKP